MPKRGGTKRRNLPSIPRKGLAKQRAFNTKFQKTKRVKQNAVFKETKTRTDEEVHARFSQALPSAYYNQNPLVPHLFPTADKVFPLKLFSYDAQQQGMDEEMMNGRAIYGKYLKCKIKLDFPESVNTPQDNCEIFLVHGWIKKSPNLNGVSAVEGVIDPNDWNLQHDWDWLRGQLEPFFDEREDKLRYISKQNSNIAISGYTKVVPKQREGFGRPRTTLGTITTDPATTQIRTVGTLLPYHRTVKWNLMRKVHYELGASSQFQSEAHVVSRPNLMYINTNQWRPFVCLYRPDMGAPGVNPPLTNENYPKVSYNSCLWYTDS